VIGILSIGLPSLAFAFDSSVKIEVTATAYNSIPNQTDSTPNLAAWNNRIYPGDKIIAVSRDLLKLGLTNGVKVKIVGFPGMYTVRDKMNKRWRKKIDIYMGNDRKSAVLWGKRKVSIIWVPKSKVAKNVTKSPGVVKVSNTIKKTVPKDISGSNLLEKEIFVIPQDYSENLPFPVPF